jgi:hypothetical protein
MDEAGRTRRAARDTIDDVEPEALRENIDELLRTRSMSPGALVFRVAETADEGIEPTTVSEHAAGVQLVYDGLRLTRELAHDEPWIQSDHRAEADMSILAADVMVSRGFHLLARTDAARKAVETVRAFGRDQTVRRENATDDPRHDSGLEADILELAIVAATSLTAAKPATDLLERADAIGGSLGVPLPPAEQLLAEFDASGPSASTVPDDGVSAPDG